MIFMSVIPHIKSNMIFGIKNETNIREVEIDVYLIMC